MSNNGLLSLTALALTTAVAWSACSQEYGFCAESRSVPNIVLVLADDLGYSDLGCYGGEILTPNIDALARRGVRFTELYNSARCCPSRASLITGLYPSQAGIGDFVTAQPSPNRGPGYLGRLNDQCVTLAEVLKPAGYGCYYVGKWHLHEQTGPIQRGFDEPGRHEPAARDARRAVAGTRDRVRAPRSPRVSPRRLEARLVQAHAGRNPVGVVQPG